MDALKNYLANLMGWERKVFDEEVYYDLYPGNTQEGKVTEFLRSDGFEPELSDRTFECSGCGERLDRDLNASKNIKQRGIDILAGWADHQSKNTSGEDTAGCTTTSTIEVSSLNEEPFVVANVA